MVFYRCGGGSDGELHGAKIIAICANADSIGQPCKLYFNDEVVQSDVIGEDFTCTFSDVIELGNYIIKITINGNEHANDVDISAEDVIYKRNKEVDIALEQAVKYTMLYDRGNEYSGNSGGWTAYTYKGSSDRGTTTATKYSSYLYTYAYGRLTTDFAMAMFYTGNVDLMDKSRVYVRYKGTGSNIAIRPGPKYSYNPAPVSLEWNNGQASASAYGWGYVNAKKVEFTPTHVSLAVSAMNSSKNTSYYNVCFVVKDDDYSTLCSRASVEAPETLNALVSDTAKLKVIFASKQAIEYMLKACTGTFMAHVMAVPSALSALKASPYYQTIRNNAHWALFIDIASAA